MATDAPRGSDAGAAEEGTDQSASAERDDSDEDAASDREHPLPHPAFAAYADESIPGAGVGAPGKEGTLELSFETDADGSTVLARDYARVPFHVSGTLDRDPHPDATTVVVQSPNGGIAQGDRHDVRVAASDGAVARVGTGSSTKVLSMEHNYGGAALSLAARSGAHLEYLPEPTILHADARFGQTIDLAVDADATAILGEVVVPGRLAREERFDFERYASRVRIEGPDGPIAEDPTHLASGADGADAGGADAGSADSVEAGGDPRAAGVLAEFEVYGTLYVVAPAADADALCAAVADRLEERLAERDRDSERDAVRAAPTALPRGGGAVVRAVGHDADPVQDALWAAWDAARRELLDAPAPEAWY